MKTAAKLRVVASGNHPNRGRRGPFSNPKPAEVIAAREATGKTQTKCAEEVRSRLKSWQNWETPVGSGEHRPMPPGLFELFLIKNGLPLPEWMKREEE